MLDNRDPAAPPNFGIDFSQVTDEWVLIDTIARLQATKIPDLLTVMHTLHDDLIELPYDEPLRDTADVMMRDAAIRLGCAAMNLMLGTERLRELQRQAPRPADTSAENDDEFPF